MLLKRGVDIHLLVQYFSDFRILVLLVDELTRSINFEDQHFIVDFPVLDRWRAARVVHRLRHGGIAVG